MRMLQRLLSGLIGFPLLIVGIVLVPLPGPGFLICFIALFILSLGFDWAQSYFERAKNALRTIYNRAKQQSENIEDKLNKR